MTNKPDDWEKMKKKSLPISLSNFVSAMMIRDLPLISDVSIDSSVKIPCLCIIVLVVLVVLIDRRQDLIQHRYYSINITY